MPGTRTIRWTLLAVLALLAAACSDCGNGTPDPQPQPQAGLLRFSDCSDLSGYLKQTRDAEAGLFGSFDMAWETANEVMTPEADSGASAADDGAEREYTSTNVQEAGVDEADFVKSDGDFLYLVTGGHLLIFDAWPAGQTGELARRELEGDPFALFVEGDVAAVLSRVWDLEGLDAGFVPQSWEVVKLSLFDLSDRSAPTLLRESYLEGSYADARLVEGRLHLVLTTGVHSYGAMGMATDDVTVAQPGGEGGTSSVTSVPAALAVGMDDSFPSYLDKVYVGGGAVPRVDLLCACENVYRPAEENGSGFLTLLTLNLDNPQGELESVSLLGNSGIVYASTDSLYVAAANNDVWLWWPVAEGESKKPRSTTTLHRFVLGSEPAYAGSGQVPGWVLNQFSLSEHEGVLRVATTEPAWVTGSGPENRVFALGHEGEALKELGRLEGIGKPGESIFAVRFLGSRGFVVTFERIDPLYALDLSDPTAPKVAGELEVPGFSTYLHPLGEERLIAVGRDPENNSLKLSLFDVADLADSKELDSLLVGAGSYSDAEYDHHAFTYYSPAGVLALPVTAWGQASGPEFYGGWDVFAGLHLYDVDPQAGFSLRGTVDHAEFFRDDAKGGWYSPEAVRRSLFIGEEGAGDFLYSVSRRGLKVTELADLSSDVAKAELPAEDLWWIYPMMEIDGEPAVSE